MTTPETLMQPDVTVLSTEDMMREQTLLLRQILEHLREEKKSRRIRSFLVLLFGVVKYVLILLILYMVYGYMVGILNESIARIEKSVPSIPSFSTDSIPGLDKIQLPYSR